MNKKFFIIHDNFTPTYCYLVEKYDFYKDDVVCFSNEIKISFNKLKSDIINDNNLKQSWYEKYKNRLKVRKSNE